MTGSKPQPGPAGWQAMDSKGAWEKILEDNLYFDCGRTNKGIYFVKLIEMYSENGCIGIVCKLLLNEVDFKKGTRRGGRKD